MIPYGRQHIGEQELAAVAEVLTSTHLTQGPVIERFEQAIADYCQVEYAVAVSSGTAALHLACMAMELGSGDYLWTTPNTFVASANCGRYCGARIDFVDIDPVTRNLCPQRLAQKLALAEQRQCLPKVLVVVHFAGLPCDMRAIAQLAERYGFLVIEDAAHAMGSHYEQQPVGSCQYSAMTVFSYHPVKTMTTGEGGVVTCRDKILSQRLRALRHHGVTRDCDYFDSSSHGPWYYEQQELGFNYRLTDIQAAIGKVQLSKLDRFVDKRQQLVDRYDEAFAPLPIKRVSAAGQRIAWHLYVIELPAELDRLESYLALQAKGIAVNVHYIPVHMQPYYQRQGFSVGDFPACEAYYASALTLPLFPELTVDEQELVIKAVEELF